MPDEENRPRVEESTEDSKSSGVLDKDKLNKSLENAAQDIGLSNKERKVINQNSLLAARDGKGKPGPKPGAKVEEQGLKVEEFKKICFSPGVQDTMAALYQRGSLLIYITAHTSLKIPKEFSHDQNELVNDSQAKAYVNSLTQLLIDTYGAEKISKNLILVTVIALPVIQIGGALIEDMQRAKVAEELKKRG